MTPRQTRQTPPCRRSSQDAFLKLFQGITAASCGHSSHRRGGTMAQLGPRRQCGRSCERRADTTGSGPERAGPRPRGAMKSIRHTADPPLLAVARPGRRRRSARRANRAVDRADRGGQVPLYRDFQPDLLLERRGRLRPHRLDHLPEGPRHHRRPEHPAGQGFAAHPGELSGRRVLGDARGQPAEAGERAVVAGARLCAVHAAGGAQGVRADGAANQAAACVEPVRPAVGIRQRDRPPGLPAGRARHLRRLRARPRTTGDRRRRAWS